jgi:hypothetical protein
LRSSGSTRRRTLSVSARPFTSTLALTLAMLFLLFFDHIDHGVEVFEIELDLWGPPGDSDQQFG